MNENKIESLITTETAIKIIKAASQKYEIKKVDKEAGQELADSIYDICRQVSKKAVQNSKGKKVNSEAIKIVEQPKK